MTKKYKFVTLLCCTALVGLSFVMTDWGFYAHRKINYYAVLTVPPPLNQFFKEQIHYLSSYAVKPDQRRYAVSAEGPRHFIDLDRWIKGDSILLTKDYAIDRITYGEWRWVSKHKNILLLPGKVENGRVELRGLGVQIDIDSFALRQEVHGVPADSTILISPSFYPEHEGNLYFKDTFTAHGIIPYHVERMYYVLVKQMARKDLVSVLNTCADLGHYISDAHVPLHTTSNYNGQFTNQIGIHAFWETRIPELFEATEFSSLVGRAQYIENIHSFIWKAIEKSYRLVPIVLEKEREARNGVESQLHYCYEERGNALVRTQCPRLARKYMDLMDEMVQNQWQSAISSVGSVWYSAWIDAGQPELWTDTSFSMPDTSIVDRIRYMINKSASQNRSDLH